MAKHRGAGASPGHGELQCGGVSCHVSGWQVGWWGSEAWGGEGHSMVLVAMQDLEEGCQWCDGACGNTLTTMDHSIASC